MKEIEISSQVYMKCTSLVDEMKKNYSEEGKKNKEFVKKLRQLYEEGDNLFR